MKHSDARYPDEIAEDIARSQTLPATEEQIARRSAATCSPSSTPETSKAWDDVSRTPDGMYDSRVNIREYAYAMLDHSRKMERERNAAGRMWAIYQDALAELREQVRLTIMENLHLADGDDCTLKRLKDSIGFDLDSPENA